MNKIIISLLLICSSCISLPEDYTHIATKIQRKTASQLEKEKGLWAIGDSGQMYNDIQTMGLAFEYFHLVNLEEARALLVYTIQVFLNNINDSKEVRPFLHNYPFTTKNIEITIWIYQESGNNPPLENIECVRLHEDKLSYKLTAPSKFELWPILHEETYAEALEALRKQNSTTE